MQPRAQLLFDLAAGEVQDFGGDLLLTGFVVDEGELGEEVFAVIGCGLHGNGSRRVLRSRAVQEGRVEFEFERLRGQRRGNRSQAVRARSRADRLHRPRQGGHLQRPQR